MTCPCEACKAVRAARAKRRADVKADTIVDRGGVLRGRMKRFEGLEARCKSANGVEWVCADGRRIKLQAMDRAHLFFAIAKGYRGEYPTHTRVTALENEALRRLIGGTWPEDGR